MHRRGNEPRHRNKDTPTETRVIRERRRGAVSKHEGMMSLLCSDRRTKRESTAGAGPGGRGVPRLDPHDDACPWLVPTWARASGTWATCGGGKNSARSRPSDAFICLRVTTAPELGGRLGARFPSPFPLSEWSPGSEFFQLVISKGSGDLISLSPLRVSRHVSFFERY